jgi:enhancing lycopene biosynthesis protein 2
MSRVGVVLSGCGVNDGSEIHEAVITMLELDKAGAEMVLMAPNIDQMHVVNHYTGTEMDEYRNVLMESARIARGDIKDMAEVSSSDVDALIFPADLELQKI